jgi:nucleoside-triphosphatase THEP1
MVSTRNKLILWVGEKHCGKTTSAANFARAARDEGFNVAGLLAPSLYRDGRLIGFDALDLRNEKRAPLAGLQSNPGESGRFAFATDGLKLGNAALSEEATKSADLIIVDEFGPLELNGDGWRKDVDSLLASSDAVILLVVRRELAGEVRQLYADTPYRELAATEPGSIDYGLTVLKDRRRLL